MAEITIALAGRSFQVACGDGQEEHVRRLAGDLDVRARQLVGRVGPVSDGKLLTMLCLVLADELAESRGTAGQRAGAGLDQVLANGVDALARRIDAIADRLGKV